MKGILYLIKTILLSGLLLSVLLIFDWWMDDCYVTSNTCEVVPYEIKAAMQNMGPLYEYRLHPDGTLEVCLDGEWLRLKYSKFNLFKTKGE